MPFACSAMGQVSGNTEEGSVAHGGLGFALRVGRYAEFGMEQRQTPGATNSVVQPADPEAVTLDGPSRAHEESGGQAVPAENRRGKLVVVGLTVVESDHDRLSGQRSASRDVLDDVLKRDDR
jgi:hypothetical protein